MRVASLEPARQRSESPVALSHLDRDLCTHRRTRQAIGSEDARLINEQLGLLVRASYQGYGVLVRGRGLIFDEGYDRFERSA